MQLESVSIKPNPKFNIFLNIFKKKPVSVNTIPEVVREPTEEEKLKLEFLALNADGQRHNFVDFESFKYYKNLQTELIAEVDLLIIDKSPEKILLLLKQGYYLNITQCLSICKKEASFYSSELKTHILTNNINDIKVCFIEELKKSLSTTSIFHPMVSFNEMVEMIEPVIKYTGHHVYFQDGEFCLEFTELCKKCYRRTLAIDANKGYTSDSSESLKKIISTFENNNKELFLQDFNDKFSKFLPVMQGFESMKKIISIDLLISVNKFNEKDIPQESRNVINALKEIYRETLHNKLTAHQQLELDNIYKKRFPQVLEEYMIISPRYREKLKLHDENPDRLLLESLLEIKNKVNYIFEQVQENNVNKLKVTTKYLKNV